MTESLSLGTSTRRLDPVALEQGVERECPLRPGFTVYVLPAASWNPRYLKALRKRARAVQVKTVGESVDEDDAADFVTSRYEDPRFIAEALVAGWSGVRNEDGEEVPYTVDRGEAAFGDEGNADVRQWIVGEAMQHGQFYTEQIKEDAGNSPNGSSGKRAGAEGSDETTS